MPVKIEGGVPYHADAYLYVPDKTKPSTWKLRIKERVGGRIKVTKAQLGRAAAAIGPGFRGNRVQLPSGVVKGLKARLRSLYRSVGVKPELIPPYIREQLKGDGKPRGDDGLMYEGKIQDLFEGPLTPKGTVVEIDEKAGVLKGVAMIGLISANRRRYKAEALKEAYSRGLYEGAPCYLDHNPDRRSGRRVRDLVGRWINTRFDEVTGKGRGDLKTLQLHRDLVIDIAKNGPELAAPSHVAEGRVKKVRENGSVIEEVDRIEKVYSVDLVAGAATVASLTEDRKAEGKEMVDVDKMTVEELKTVRPDLFEHIVSEATGGEDMGEIQKLLKEQNAAIDELKKKLEAAEAEKEKIKKVQETKSLLEKHLKESKLPEKAQEELVKLYDGQVLNGDQIKAIIEAQTRYLESVLGKSLVDNKLNIPAGDGPTGNQETNVRSLLAEGFAKMAGLDLKKDEDDKKDKNKE